MSKRFLLIVMVFSLLSFPVFASTEKVGKEAVAGEEKVFTGRAEYQNLRAFLNFVAEAMEGLELKFQDARVSPIVMSEQWFEFPIEIGWAGTQDTLAPLLEKVLGYSFADSRTMHGSICISCSAETREDGQVILTIASLQKLMCFGGAEKIKDGNPSELWKAVSKRNQQIIRAVRSLLNITTFNPQVRKKIQGGGIGTGKTWITNMRIDNDNRIQLTGYALDVKEATQLGEDLLKSGSFKEVFLSSMNRNIYEKVPVWRFDFSAKVN